MSVTLQPLAVQSQEIVLSAAIASAWLGCCVCKSSQRHGEDVGACQGPLQDPGPPGVSAEIRLPGIITAMDLAPCRRHPLVSAPFVSDRSDRRQRQAAGVRRPPLAFPEMETHVAFSGPCGQRAIFLTNYPATRHLLLAAKRRLRRVEGGPRLGGSLLEGVLASGSCS